jgi:hypothetical protein
MNKRLKVALAFLIAATFAYGCSSKTKLELKNNREIKFEYEFNNNYNQEDQYKIKNYEICRDTVKFYFCSGGGCCDYKYELKANKDTLEIVEIYDRNTRQLHKILFCVDCKILGLKAKEYFIKANGEFTKIKITENF